MKKRSNELMKKLSKTRFQGFVEVPDKLYNELMADSREDYPIAGKVRYENDKVNHHKPVCIRIRYKRHIRSRL